MVQDCEFSVLIVDDDRYSLKVLHSILKDDYTVITAKSGKEAMTEAVSHMPDLILLDLIMPDLDGFEVLHEISNNELTSKIPIIILTGMEDVALEERAFSLGAVDYITKPYHGSIVKARVKVHLQIISQMRTIERFGLIDALTGIPNRRSYDNCINAEWGRAIREKMPLALLMIDVDNFKEFNDTCGHPQGDMVLKIISKEIVKTVKRSTDLVFRWGGEEFAVILVDTDIYGAIEVAERIRRNVESLALPRVVGGFSSIVTVSVGAHSLIPALDISVFDFVTKADKALYKAKREGRNKVCI